MGYLDDEGYLFINDRKKDMILVSGFNVYPNEVESVAVELDGVLEAANSEDVDFKDGALLSNKSKFTSGNLDKVIHSLLDEAVAWADGKRLDDISAVGVEVKEAD